MPGRKTRMVLSSAKGWLQKSEGGGQKISTGSTMVMMP